MTYNTKFKPSKKEVKPLKIKGRKHNVSVYWRSCDEELRAQFEAACKSSELKESDMLRQMITYSLERMTS